MKYTWIVRDHNNISSVREYCKLRNFLRNKSFDLSDAKLDHSHHEYFYYIRHQSKYAIDMAMVEQGDFFKNFVIQEISPVEFVCV